MVETDPKNVAAAFVEALAAKDYAAWDDLIAEEVVAKFPFSPEGMPTEFNGRDQWREATRQMFEPISTIRFYDVEMISTEDPEFVVATSKSEADFFSGKKYQNQYVLFFRVRDGKVVEYSEHFDPLAILKVLAAD